MSLFKSLHCMGNCTDVVRFLNRNYDGVDNQRAFIEGRVEAAANNLGVNKPFLLEEFGMSILDPDDTDLAYPNDDGGRNAPVRDSYFRSAYEGEFLRVISVRAIILTGKCFVYSRVVTGEERKALRDAVLALVRSRGRAGEVRRAVERLDVQADRGARGGDERNHRRAAILRRVISLSLSV